MRLKFKKPPIAILKMQNRPKNVNGLRFPVKLNRESESWT